VKGRESGTVRNSFVCADLSHDSIASFAASLGAEVEDPAAIEAAVQAAFRDSARSLGGHTATIQLFRDALHRACLSSKTFTARLAPFSFTSPKRLSRRQTDCV
jgi:hypothetical protein